MPRSEAELAALMAETRLRILPAQGGLDLDLKDAAEATRPGTITGRTSAVLWRALAGAYARVGFEVLGDEAVRPES